MDYDNDDAEMLDLLIKALQSSKASTSQMTSNTPVPAPSAEEPKAPVETTTKEKRKRCGCCNKKLGLITFPCKCGGEFCSLHRSTADHSCSFDFQADAKKFLSTNLVKVTAKKMETV
jgi:predicted nucleic acid binding AN1-type Zn finger protein